MGKGPRPKPQRLAQKLLGIRRALGLTQIELVMEMGINESSVYKHISEYESGRREPSLLLILAYARIAGVHVEEIINDLLDLPDKLPGKVMHP